MMPCISELGQANSRSMSRQGCSAQQGCLDCQQVTVHDPDVSSSQVDRLPLPSPMPAYMPASASFTAKIIFYFQSSAMLQFCTKQFLICTQFSFDVDFG